MKKHRLEPGTSLYPVPAVMVSCQDRDGNTSIIAIAWTGVMASRPPTVGIGVRRSRYSHALIEDTGEFVINIPTRELVRQLDYCGNVSGKDVNKFAETGLTRIEPSVLEYAPLVGECPLNLECRVIETLDLGSHDYFVGEVVAVNASDEWVEDGGLHPAAGDMVAYARGVYYGLADKLEVQGFSVRG